MKENYIRKKVNINNKEISFFIDYDNKDIYMSQEELTKLFNTSIHAIKRLINNPTGAKFALVQNSWRYFEIENNEGSRLIKRNIKHYSLIVIKEIGYKLNPNLLNELLNKLEDIFNNISNREIIDNSLNKAINYEIVKYYDGNFSLDVSVSPMEDTIWLTQEQIASLFEKSISTINEHINNILIEELDEFEVCRKFGKTELSSIKTKPILYYNLDMIISIGYRVNSKRGIAFRKWATSILKKYLLKGYAYDEKRCIECNSNMWKLMNRMDELENRMDKQEKELKIDDSMSFDKSDYYGPYIAIRRIFFCAKSRLIIFDPYADDGLLSMLEKIDVDITIYTTSKSAFLKVPFKANIKIINDCHSHSRIIIEDNNAYHLSHSFNAIGKAVFIISKIDNIVIDCLIENIKKA